MSESLIMVTLEGHVAVITLNRPQKLNALNVEMLDSLLSACDTIEHNTEVRVVILTGAGDRAFCVGADIHAWSSLQPLDMWRQWVRYGHQIMNRIEGLRQPVIAALNGYTFGGGLELALAADIRIAVDEVEFALPEATIGTLPGWGGTNRLPNMIGVGRAKEMMLTGDRIDAGTAERWGLVNHVVNADELIGTSRDLAEKIATNAPIAVQLTKQIVNANISGDSRLANEAIASAVSAMTNDGIEGVTAFREKRSPKFNGS